MYAYIHASIWIPSCIYVYIYKYINIFIYIHIYMYTGDGSYCRFGCFSKNNYCILICMHTFMHLYGYPHVYMYIYINMFIYIHIYIHIYMHTGDGSYCRFGCFSKNNYCILICMHTFMHLYGYPHVYMYIYINIFIYIHIYMYTGDGSYCRFGCFSKNNYCILICMHTFMHLYGYPHVYMYIYINIFIYIHIYIHIYMHTGDGSYCRIRCFSKNRKRETFTNDTWYMWNCSNFTTRYTYAYMSIHMNINILINALNHGCVPYITLQILIFCIHIYVNYTWCMWYCSDFTTRVTHIYICVYSYE
jgi:hypothetical protein